MQLHDWDPNSWTRSKPFLSDLIRRGEMIDEVKSRWEFKETFPDRDWVEFRNAVRWLEQTRDREDLALVEKTYYQFWKGFAAIAGENSDQLSQVEWWPPATLGSPIFLRISRKILLLGVLLLFGGIIFFVYYLFETAILAPAHFDQQEGFPASSRDLFSEASALCFCLSVVVFAVWALLNLWPKMRPRSQK